MGKHFRSPDPVGKRTIPTIAGLCALFFSVFGVPCLFAETWARTYGSQDAEHPQSIRQLPDGGFIMGGDLSVGSDYLDVWGLRADAAGNVVWAKRYDAPVTSICTSLEDAGDGCVIGAGSLLDINGMARPFIFRLDELGNVLWQKIASVWYGNVFSVLKTADGGYVAVGKMYAGPGEPDFWILKLDASGNALWQKTCGGRRWEAGVSIVQTQDGGYACAGNTVSFGSGEEDGWLLKLDGNGEIEWQKAYGGPLDDVFDYIRQLPDGGYYIAGWTESFGVAGYDVWVLRLDSAGSIQWEKTFGGDEYEGPSGLVLTDDGGCALLCRTDFFNGDTDWWLLKLDALGGVQWQKRYGGVFNYGFWEYEGLDNAPDGGFILAVDTDSFGSGLSDAWILKVDSNGDIESPCPYVLDSSVQGIDSSAVVTETPAVALDLNADVVDAPYQMVDVAVGVLQQCPGSDEDEDEDGDEDEESDQVRSLIPRIPSASVDSRPGRASDHRAATRHRP
jgi:hypothetical protein